MRALLFANVNALIFAAGFGTFVAGLSAWSRPLAAMVAGGLLMLLGVWPYLQRRRA